jgi:hypothetical protein
MTLVDEAVFPLTYSCGPSLAPGESCTFSVTFKPASTGTTTAMMLVESNSGLLFQQVSLYGTSPQSGFVISTQTGGNMSSTVTAGSTAAYALTITPAGGYSGNIHISCNNLPANASCTFSPASLTVASGTPTNFRLLVATESNSTTALLRTERLGVALAGFLCLIPLGPKRKRAAALICFGTLLLITGISACGGGSSGTTGTTTQQSAKVTPGTYAIKVAASDTSGNQMTQSITLIVQ